MVERKNLEINYYYYEILQEFVVFVGLQKGTILQPRFCKVDYRSVNVQCSNSPQDNTTIIDDGSGGSDVGM